METPSEAGGKLQDIQQKESSRETSTLEDNTDFQGRPLFDCLKDEKETDSTSQKELDKNNTVDQQSDSIPPIHTNENSSQDQQSDSISPIDKNENSSQDQQSESIHLIDKIENSSHDQQSDSIPSIETNENSSQDQQLDSIPPKDTDENSSQDQQSESIHLIDKIENSSHDQQSDSIPSIETNENSSQDQQLDSIPPKDTDENSSQDQQSDSIPLIDTNKNSSQDKQTDSIPPINTNENSSQNQKSDSIASIDTNETISREQQSDSIFPINTNENSSQDQQSDSISPIDKNESSSQDQQSYFFSQRLSVEHKTQSQQHISDQKKFDEESTQGPRYKTCSHKEENSPLDTNDPQDRQSNTKNQVTRGHESTLNSQSGTRIQKESYKDGLDKKPTQDPPSETCSHKELDQGSSVDRQSEHLSLSQRDKDSTRGGQSSSRSEPSGTERRQGTRSVSRENRRDYTWLMSTFVSGIVFGALVTISYGFISPWFNPPVPGYNIAPSGSMCPVNHQNVQPLQNDFNSSTETRIQEEMDKRESILKAYLEEKVQSLMVKVKMDVSRSVQDKMKVLKEDLNASTQNCIKEFVGNLEVRLNKSIENRLQEIVLEQNKMFNKTMKKIEDAFQQHKKVTGAAMARTERRFTSRSRSILMGVLDTVDHLRTHLLEKFKAVDAKQELVYRVIDGMNFMRTNSWGMLVFFIGVMEAALYIYVCVLLKNPRPRDPNNHLSAQVAPPIKVARGDNNTLCFVYFVDRDIERIRKWTNEVIKETRAYQRINTVNHVIVTRHDIPNIPTCRLALVFVNPDERQLILEDDCHMGRTRRDTVQALCNNGAEVVLVAYGDPTSRIRVLDDGLLLDPSLTQVTSHPVLRELNSRRRILSVKESFSTYQKRHLVDTIDQMFT